MFALDYHQVRFATPPPSSWLSGEMGDDLKSFYAGWMIMALCCSAFLERLFDKVHWRSWSFLAGQELIRWQWRWGAGDVGDTRWRATKLLQATQATEPGICVSLPEALEASSIDHRRYLSWMILAARWTMWRLRWDRNTESRFQHPCPLWIDEIIPMDQINEFIQFRISSYSVNISQYHRLIDHTFVHLYPWVGLSCACESKRTTGLGGRGISQGPVAKRKAYYVAAMSILRI